MQKLTAILFFFGAAACGQPTITSVVNAASEQPTFAPGSLAAVRGSHFGLKPTVSVDGKAGFVADVPSDTYFWVQLPVDLTPGPTTLTVSANGETSSPFPVTIASYAPAFFTQDMSGSGIGSFGDSTEKLITVDNPASPGQLVISGATGLGATNPTLPTGAMATAQAPTTAKVTITIGGEFANVTYSGLTISGTPGYYSVIFTVPTNATGCGISVVLTIGGVSSPPVLLPIATSQTVICATENSATGALRDAGHGTAANSFVSIYASGTGVSSSGTNLFPATNYQGVEADYNGTPLPLYSVTILPPSEILINTALPANAGTSGSGVLTVKGSNGVSQSYTVGLTSADIGVFRLPDPNDPARIQGVALLANTYWFAMPASLAPSYNLTACTGLPAASPCGQPAHPGDSIVIYFSGGGLATPTGDPNGEPLGLGAVAPADGSVLYKTVTQPTITIGGLPAPMEFSGIAPGTASEYQINTTIPTGVQPGDDVPIVITIGNSTDTVTIAVKAQ